jgi:hypothetical protein
MKRSPSTGAQSGCHLGSAAVATRATIAAGAAFTTRRFPVTAGATVPTRAAVAGATLVVREPGSSRTPEGEVAFYLVGSAAVQSIENVLPILRAKLVKHIVGADHTHVGAGFSLSDKVSHRRRKLEVVNNADRSPHAWTSSRPLPPPLPHDDDEITPAENRADMIARHPVEGTASVRTVPRAMRASLCTLHRMRRLRGFTLFTLGAWAGMIGAAAFARRAVPSRGDEDSDELGLVAVFDGIDLKSRAKAFTGGSMLAWFGGITVDLREVELAPGARLSLHALFGGIQIKTPRSWRVESGLKAIAGGVDARTPGQDDPDAPVLTVTGTALFGGIAIGAKATGNSRHSAATNGSREAFS